MSRKAFLDARNWPVPPESKLAGLPLFLRTVLTLQRAGFDSVQVHHAGDWHRLERILSARPLTIRVEPTEEAPEPQNTLLKACALYDPLPAMTLVREISTPGDLDAAASHLWNKLRKPIENDGVVAYFLGRPVSRVISRVLVHTPLTPNHVTLLSLLSALAGAALLSFSLVGGAALYWFSFVLDCVDGELARLRFQGSRAGQWLDTVADDLATVAFSTGLGILVYKQMPAAGIAGLALAAAYALSTIPVYLTLAKMPVIDTAQYPYFFMGEKGAASEEKGFFTLLAYGFRRDVVLFIHLVLSLFGLLGGMFLLQTVINAGMAVITWLDVAVKAFRR